MKVNVKWNTNKYEMDLDLQDSVSTFKAQLYSVTGVEPDRQKLLSGGKFLKDETDLSTIKFKEGQLITLMGSVGEINTAPKEKVTFIEDMTESEITEALKLPVGLINLGNTCYMNASLQILKSIPELETSLQNYQGHQSKDGDPQGNMVNSLKGLFKELKNSGSVYPPFIFLQSLRQAFPKFSQQEGRGNYSQQDAEECWSSILTSLQNKLNDTNGNSFVSNYFGGKFKTKMSSEEAPEEEATIGEETFFKLDCHITKEVNHLTVGLNDNFINEIEKNSPSLNRMAKYKKEFKIDRLPTYLPINYVRFFWKPAERIKAKILKKVKFPMELDLYSYCTKELQTKLDLARNKIEQIDEEERNKKVKLEKEEQPRDYNKEIYEVADNELKKDMGANYTGYYQLHGVLTHTGRSADSGHYIAWVRQNKKEWIKFDDDKVTIVDEQAILKLDGGGDWHMAYILLYSSKQF
ncbi:cysteine proteinase [Neoconidiobolus thromboides FSU 785]|nr:cysteine proteinase [Neoconidiobolus thromboides FSU 785]